MKQYLVITGASKGIGKSIAALFLMQGWQVLNISRQACDLPEVINLRMDLLAKDSLSYVKLFLDEQLPANAKICLVHNAAFYESDQIDTVHATRLRKAMELNVMLPIQLNQLVLPRMVDGSSILYIGSTLSDKAVPKAASYIISKHALLGAMRVTCQDLAGRGVHTASICPGFTDTEMLRAHTAHDPAVLEALKGRVGANRLIEPQEIAELVFFAAENPVINGSVLHANLGQLER